jgi:hypothetical protein
MDAHATVEILLETVFSTRSLQRDYKDDKARRGSWKGAAIQRGPGHGSIGIAIVGAVIRKRLVTD